MRWLGWALLIAGVLSVISAVVSFDDEWGAFYTGVCAMLLGLATVYLAGRRHRR